MAANASSDANRDFGADRARDPRRGGRDRPRARTSSTGRRAATSCPSSCAPARAAARRCARPRSAWRANATSRRDASPDDEQPVTVELDPREFVTRPQGRRAWVREGRRALDAAARARGAARSPRTAPIGCLRRAGAWRKSSTSSTPRTPPMTRGGRGVAADGSRRMAPGMVKAHEPVLVPTGLMNITDHDSRPMRTHGFKPLQGYNAQLAVNEQQVVIAAELTCDSPDFGHLEPMVRATQRELRGVERRRPERRARRRRLLASAPDRDGRQRRHPGARPTGLRPAPRHAPGLDRRPLRLHAPRARDPARPRALPPAPGHDRARLRPAQVQPPDPTASNAAAEPPAARNGD